MLFHLQGVQLIKAQPANKKRQATSPPLYGGFSSVQPPQRQERPPKPEPVFYPKTSAPSPTYRPVPVTTPSPSVSYDPFNFQVNPTERIDKFEAEIEPSAAPDYSEESTIVPVYLTSEYPELPALRRVPKSSASGGPPPSVAENEISDR